MKIGDLYRVCETGTHKPCQFNNLFIATGRIGISIIVGINLNTGKKHHYSIDDLEKL